MAKPAEGSRRARNPPDAGADGAVALHGHV